MTKPRAKLHTLLIVFCKAGLKCIYILVCIAIIFQLNLYSITLCPLCDVIYVQFNL